jgi:UDP-4-amino-4,6-dideoxy-N-acetyl-beta-L-altrosamine N-acetyltransferase
VDFRKDISLDDFVLVSFLNLTSEEKKMVRIWRNHDKVRKWMYQDHEISSEEHAKFIERLKGDDKNFYWILKSNQGEYVGTISLNRVDFRNNNAYLGLYSNPYYDRPGAGVLLIAALKKLAFDLASLHTLKLEVLETNHLAINFYKKSGFSEEGRLKEFAFKDNRRHHVIVMGLTRTERV